VRGCLGAGLKRFFIFIPWLAEVNMQVNESRGNDHPWLKVQDLQRLAGFQQPVSMLPHLICRASRDNAPFSDQQIARGCALLGRVYELTTAQQQGADLRALLHDAPLSHFLYLSCRAFL